MKKVELFAAIAASFFMLVSASVYEGTASIGENFPENGPYLATNSIPVNTLVEVVNLENNKSAIFIVSARLDNSRLLAMLSREAADAIGLNTVGRILMKERDDQVPYYELGDRTVFSGDPDTGKDRTEGWEYISDLDGYDLSFLQAEPRPPEDKYFREPDPDSFISSINKTTEPPVVIVIPAIPAAAPERPSPPPVASGTTTPRFSAPLIQNLDRGSYYVQIGAYRTAQTVESEIHKVIDKKLPVAVMRIESEKGPIYRVLVGPLNLGESKTILQNYKAIYKDAFLRVGT